MLRCALSAGAHRLCESRRGASKSLVYDGGRLLPAELTRLFEDAHSAQEWRQVGFYPVLNERDQTPQANRNAGVMASRMWRD